MDIYTYLKKDHRKVADLMEEVIGTTDKQERAALFAKIKKELTLHADTEEVTFYATLKKVAKTKNVEEKMEHADAEHDEIRNFLEKLSNLPVEDEKWIETFGEFKHAVTHHVDEEESEIFEKARKYLSDTQAENLAAEMDALKQKKMAKHAA